MGYRSVTGDKGQDAGLPGFLAVSTSILSAHPCTNAVAVGARSESRDYLLNRSWELTASPHATVGFEWWRVGCTARRCAYSTPVDVAAVRGDEAGIHTLDSAHDKAYTSVSFKNDTLTLAEGTKDGDSIAPLAKLPHVMFIGE